MSTLLLLHSLRIPDPRDLQDRTYRVRYVIDKDKSNPLPRPSYFVVMLHNPLIATLHHITCPDLLYLRY